MKINYGLKELLEIHEDMIDIVNHAEPLTVEWLACGTFLAEAYELEVTKHGGLDAEKIEEYKALCRKFFSHSDEFEL